MEYGEAIQHLTRAGVSPTSYRYYTIDNIMYFAPYGQITDDLRKTFTTIFKECDTFTVYNQFAIDLNKQIVEGAKQELIGRLRHKSRKERAKEIGDFILEDEEKLIVDLPKTGEEINAEERFI